MLRIVSRTISKSQYISSSISIPIYRISRGARNDRSANSKAGEEHAIANGTGREGDKYFLSPSSPPPVLLASYLFYYRRRYISSRRKKFNVAAKADGNADCWLWASPVTALHIARCTSLECSIRPPRRQPLRAASRGGIRTTIRRLAAIGRSLAATSLSIPRISNRLTL